MSPRRYLQSGADLKAARLATVASADEPGVLTVPTNLAAVIATALPGWRVVTHGRSSLRPPVTDAGPASAGRASACVAGDGEPALSRPHLRFGPMRRKEGEPFCESAD